MRSSSSSEELSFLFPFSRVTSKAILQVNEIRQKEMKKKIQLMYSKMQIRILQKETPRCLCAHSIFFLLFYHAEALCFCTPAPLDRIQLRCDEEIQSGCCGLQRSRAGGWGRGGVGGELQQQQQQQRCRNLLWCQSTVLSDSSSESARLFIDSRSATEFLKGEMWAKSKILSSSMLMTGMSKLQSESGRAERRGGS